MGRPTGEQPRHRASDQDQQLAALCQALAHPARVQILRLLASQGQGCFCGDVVKMVGLAQSTVSHHLKALREVGLVSAEESGSAVCYCVDRRVLQRLANLVGNLGLTDQKQEEL
jgi:ArsR family transcriptional regulator, arsenate/arsenite/antimonite-responsive transcriptional repressor